MAENNQALTKKEQDFAAAHYHLIMTHLAVNHLRFDDWYDVLVFGYLKAVRVWFRCPMSGSGPLPLSPRCRCARP